MAAYGRSITTGMRPSWLVLTVFAGIAEFEREFINQRTSSAWVTAKALGVQFDQPPKLTAYEIALRAGRARRGEIRVDYLRNRSSIANGGDGQVIRAFVPADTAWRGAMGRMNCGVLTSDLSAGPLRRRTGLIPVLSQRSGKTPFLQGGHPALRSCPDRVPALRPVDRQASRVDEPPRAAAAGCASAGQGLAGPVHLADDLGSTDCRVAARPLQLGAGSAQAVVRRPSQAAPGQVVYRALGPEAGAQHYGRMGFDRRRRSSTRSGCSTGPPRPASSRASRWLRAPGRVSECRAARLVLTAKCARSRCRLGSSSIILRKAAVVMIVIHRLNATRAKQPCLYVPITFCYVLIGREGTIQ